MQLNDLNIMPTCNFDTKSQAINPRSNALHDTTVTSSISRTVCQNACPSSTAVTEMKETESINALYSSFLCHKRVVRIITFSNGISHKKPILKFNVC
jgi:hypothetical protein